MLVEDNGNTFIVDDVIVQEKLRYLVYLADDGRYHPQLGVEWHEIQEAVQG